MKPTRREMEIAYGLVAASEMAQALADYRVELSKVAKAHYCESNECKHAIAKTIKNYGVHLTTAGERQ